MRHAKRFDADAGDRLFEPGRQVMELGRRQLAALHALAEHPLKHTADALLCAFGPGDVQRAPARMLVQIIGKEKRQPRRVIAMEMAQENRLEALRAEARSLQRQQRGRTAVEEEEPPFGLDKIAAVISAAAAEGVAASENVEFHRSL